MDPLVLVEEPAPHVVVLALNRRAFPEKRSADFAD
jgi:hypothetical protein